MSITALIAELWQMMQPAMRRWLLRVVGIAAILILVLFAYLAWHTGEIYKHYGILPTKADMSEQTDAITSAMATKDDVRQVSYELRLYQDSIARLRTHIDTTLVAPGLMAVVDLQRRMARIETGQVQTRLAIEEQRRQGEQGNAALIDQMVSMSSAERRAKEEKERQEAAQRQRDRELMEAIARKLKINLREF